MSKSRAKQLNERIHHIFSARKTMFNINISCDYFKDDERLNILAYTCYNTIQCFETYLYICSLCLHNIYIKNLHIMGQFPDHTINKDFKNLSDFRECLIENHLTDKFPPKPQEIDPTFCRNFTPKEGAIFICKPLKGCK